jgi:23S rRNA (guanine745-N1)-methyltransferase
MAMTDCAGIPDGAGPREGEAPGGGTAPREGETARVAARDFPAQAVALLRCPVCGSPFSPAPRALRCENGHSYDVARQGYVNLLPGVARPGTADTAEMVAARESFLAAGHFAGLRDFVAGAAQRAMTDQSARGRVGAGAETGAGGAEGCLVEVGAGTGYYLAGVLDRFPRRTGLALDISKFAARRAARAHERTAAIVCDVWGTLPAADGCAALVMDIFAPRNPPEFRRVLRPDGALLVVTPSPRHLQELVAALGLLKVDDRKPERLEESLGGDFELLGQDEHEETLTLTPAEAGALAAMGPSARHLRPEKLAECLDSLGELVEVTLSVTVTRCGPAST